MRGNGDEVSVRVDDAALGEDVHDADLPELTTAMTNALKQELHKAKPSCQGK